MERDIEQAAKEAAGNWKHFESFSWGRVDLEDPENWTIIYTKTRDTGLVHEVNHQVMSKALAPFKGDVFHEHHGHWGWGWQDGFAVRVYRDKEQTVLTDAFKTTYELLAGASEDESLDDELLWKLRSERIDEEFDDFCTRIAFLVNEPPDWRKQLRRWLDKHKPEVFELYEDSLFKLTRRAVLPGLVALCLIPKDSDFILRDVDIDGYRLQTWDCGEGFSKRMSQSAIYYRLTHPDGRMLFEGDDFGCSPLHSIDGDECLRALLGFLLLRPGDTDKEYFKAYSKEQLEWAENEAEVLQWVLEEPENESQKIYDGSMFKPWGGAK